MCAAKRKRNNLTSEELNQLPAADLFHGKQVDEVYKIPEERISDPCIKYVSEKLNAKEHLVNKIHDFQWDSVKKATENYSVIYVTKFFKLKLSKYKANSFIEKLKEEIVENEQKYENSLNDAQRNKYQNKIREIKEHINLLEEHLKKITSVKPT